MVSLSEDAEISGQWCFPFFPSVEDAEAIWANAAFPSFSVEDAERSKRPLLPEEGRINSPRATRSAHPGDPVLSSGGVTQTLQYNLLSASPHLWGENTSSQLWRNKSLPLITIA
ncbi:MAG: hypothetical protein NC453_24570 [Muribaculum sp.]|nr:hypothetical protein [Muribaculum sp.]